MFGRKKRTNHFIVLHDMRGGTIHIRPDAIDMLGFDSEDDTVFLYRSGTEKPVCIRESIEDVKMLFNLASHIKERIDAKV